MFGPAVGVLRATDVEHAIQLANDTPYGLSAGVFTQDLDAAVRFARGVHSGNIHINWGPMWRVDSMPYGEISKYCLIHRDKVARVFETLSYFDGLNFSARCDARAFYSVALMDQTCPPSTVFAAYNHHVGPKEIRVWRYNNHEGGATYQDVEKVKFLTLLWGQTRG